MSLLLNQDNPQSSGAQSNTGSSTVQQNNGIPVLPGSTSGVQGAATTSGGPQSTTQAPGSAPSSPWNNINSYLSNNAPQAAQMGQNVAANIQNQYSNIGNEIAQTNQNFQSAVGAASTPENASLINEVSTNPIAAASNPANVTAFQGQLNDTYTGPTDITQYTSPTNTTGTSDWANINNAINANAQTYATAASPASTQQLAQTLEGSSITPGITNLDTILLNQNPDSISAITNAAGQWNNLNSLLSQAQTSSNPIAQNAIASATAAQQDANAALQGQETSATNALEQELSNAASGVASYDNSVNNFDQEFNNNPTAISEGNLLQNGVSPYLVDALGAIAQFNQADAPEAYQLPNAETFVQNPETSLPTPPTSVGQVATSNDVALENALAALSGGSYTPLVTAPGNFTAPTGQPTFNAPGLAAALNSAFRNDTPTFVPATDPNGALADWQALQNYLNEYAGNPTPPTEGGGGPINTGPGAGTGTGPGGSSGGGFGNV